MILSCQNLTKAYGSDVIIEKASFQLEDHQKAAIVGINGAGKTTLLKMITGQLAPDEGQVVMAKNVSVGYLAQYQNVDNEDSVYNEVLLARPEILEMESELRSMEAQMGSLSGDALEELLARYHRVNDTFDREGGNSYRSEAVGVIKGLGFSDADMDRPVRELSGGQKTRVFLGKLLLSKPDLLLLDEPTNHLDMNSIAWLETYLSGYSGAVLIVSHDRYFLNRIVSKVIEVFRHRVYSYEGDYDAFSEKKAQLRKAQMKAYLNQQRDIAHQEEVIRKLKSFNREKSIKRAESREKMLEKVERLEKPEEENTDIKITLEPAVESGKDVLRAEGLSKAFGSKELFRNLSFDIKRGERVALIGDNGTGKTTILRIINGLCDADAGTLTFGTNVHIGYYDQEHAVLHPEQTLFEELQDEHPDMNNTAVRNVLAAFLFTEDEVFKRVDDLSGGERGRLSLAKLMLSEANLLILDEPTNHLDITSKEILESALNDYTGTVLFVSHDRYFINKTATRILDLTHQTLVSYIGNYDYYLEKHDVQMRTMLQQQARAGASKKGAVTETSDVPAGSRVAAGMPDSEGGTEMVASRQESGTASTPAGNGSATVLTGAEGYKARKEEQARLRKLKNQIAKAEEKIGELEEVIANLEAQLELPEVATDPVALTEITNRMDAARAELEEWYETWENLSLKIE